MENRHAKAHIYNLCRAAGSTGVFARGDEGHAEAVPPQPRQQAPEARDARARPDAGDGEGLIYGYGRNPDVPYYRPAGNRAHKYLPDLMGWCGKHGFIIPTFSNECRACKEHEAVAADLQPIVFCKEHGGIGIGREKGRYCPTCQSIKRAGVTLVRPEKSTVGPDVRDSSWLRHLFGGA